jgi:hypothetical protein
MIGLVLEKEQKAAPSAQGTCRLNGQAPDEVTLTGMGKGRAQSQKNLPEKAERLLM